MHEQGSVAVIGAGVIGSAVAYALARENRPVVLIDRAEPGTGGASYGNAGHIAAELSVPLPSVQLLFTFWRELFAWGGPLDIPVRHVPSFAPWAARFAAAALRRRRNTAHLAPLVKPASATLARGLRKWDARSSCGATATTKFGYMQGRSAARRPRRRRCSGLLCLQRRRPESSLRQPGLPPAPQARRALVSRFGARD
jgi:glycine/D-amino acid oxidase-like deaminating enzyme